MPIAYHSPATASSKQRSLVYTALRNGSQGPQGNHRRSHTTTAKDVVLALCVHRWRTTINAQGRVRTMRPASATPRAQRDPGSSRAWEFRAPDSTPEIHEYTPD
jgi:Tfp pilus assembly protein FimT